MNPKVTNDINETRQSFEMKLLEMIRRLELERDEALADLKESRSELQQGATALAEEIKHLAAHAGEDLNRIQKRLGELNFALSEGSAVRDPEGLEKMRSRLETVVCETIDDLRAMKDPGLDWSAAGGRIERTWDRFSDCLELVRIHLEEAAETASRELRDERRALVKELRKRLEDDANSASLMEHWGTVRDGYHRFERLIKTLFVHPDEAAPRKKGEHKELI